MSITLDSIIHKTVLVGLSYFDTNGELLQQRQLCGVVVESNHEKGIAVKLLTPNAHTSNSTDSVSEALKDEHFVLPSALTCWFNAPAGHYKNPANNIDIENPDFLVTWDIHKKQEQVEDGDHQWWEWQPNTAAPMVNK